MSDVTAVVLSLGESFADRAVASVRRQTFPIAETILVEHVSPFHRAFQHGASRVRTEFFLQVDADMILHPRCVEWLRARMRDEVGIAVGCLRDPLLDRIVGVKLFRTQCCREVAMRDSIVPETYFLEDTWAAGWQTVYAVNYDGASADDWHMFGEHQPDYTPQYTFCKYLRDGAKYRYRKTEALRTMFRRLAASSHPAATVATIAAAHGIFRKEACDLHAPDRRPEELVVVERLLQAPSDRAEALAEVENLAPPDYSLGFRRSYERGMRLRNQPSTFLACMRSLQRDDETAAWVALVGLCHGLFARDYREADVEDDFSWFQAVLPSQEPERQPLRIGRLLTEPAPPDRAGAAARGRQVMSWRPERFD